MDYTPIVLKNKGVPASFAKTEKVGVRDEDWVRKTDEEGNPEIEVLHVKFTNNAISEIEQHFGTLEKWQERLEQQPVSTLRQTLAYVLRRPVHQVGEAMLDGEVVNYSNIIGVAWSIANGVDPIVASRMLKESLGLAEEQKKVLNEELMKNIDSLGDSGSNSGAKRATRSKSSGNSAQPKQA